MCIVSEVVMSFFICKHEIKFNAKMSIYILSSFLRIAFLLCKINIFFKSFIFFRQCFKCCSIKNMFHKKHSFFILLLGAGFLLLFSNEFNLYNVSCQNKNIIQVFFFNHYLFFATIKCE